MPTTIVPRNNNLVSETAGSVQPYLSYSASGLLGATPVPASWDWRSQNNSAGSSLLTPVRDQQTCGAYVLHVAQKTKFKKRCYLFSSTSCLADRFSIASSGSISLVLSVESLLTCGQNFVTDVKTAAVQTLVNNGDLQAASVYDAEVYFRVFCIYILLGLQRWFAQVFFS